MSSLSPQLPVGQVIGGRYRVQSVIGRGGMGLVYAAMHELTGRRVALKLMLSECGESVVLQERFLTEARIAASVRHPNIVDVLDMGIHEGSPFLVLELLEGVSLEQLLESQTLSPEQALAWLLPVMGALAVLHDAGVVHRDLKPSNIFLSSLPRHPMCPKLLDFGLARVVSDLRLTRSGNVIGTPLYMSPEHASGRLTGPQTDVWSFGVVLYECLSGNSPFEYTDRSSLAAQVLAGAVRPLSQLRPDLPPAFVAAVNGALHRDLGRRYRDMRSFARALLIGAMAGQVPVPADPDPIGLPDYPSWRTGERRAATTIDHHVTTVPTPLLGRHEVSSSGPRVKRRPLERLVPAALGLVVLVILLLGARLLGASGDPQRSPVATVAPSPLPAAPEPVLQKLESPTVESLSPKAAPLVDPVASQADAGIRDARPSVPAPSSRSRRSERTPAARPIDIETEPPPAGGATQHVDEIEAEWK